MKRDFVFSIVTPTRNSERFISETIESVISQSGNFSIEYIIIDNCSIDTTEDIVRSYQRELQSQKKHLNCNSVEIIYLSENDFGMYDAINKGFSYATGDIYAWINSDDIYLNGCFNTISRVFREFPEVNWLKGITSYINEDSTIYSIGKCNLYAREWIKQGLYGPVLGFIQQDSVFWRRDLWERAEGVDSSLNLAGDYDLWKRFAKFSSLYSLNAYVSCFRKVRNQKCEDMDKYWKEIDDIEDLRLSTKKLRKQVIKQENKKTNNTWPRMFKSRFNPAYHLITVNAESGLKLYDGSFIELKKYL